MKNRNSCPVSLEYAFSDEITLKLFIMVLQIRARDVNSVGVSITVYIILPLHFKPAAISDRKLGIMVKR